MKKSSVVSWIRIGFGLLTFSAVITQLFTSINLGRSVVNFFSFFTIESNILAGTLLLLTGIYGLLKRRVDKLDFLRGAATLYMSMTGIIYLLLLSGNEVALQTTTPWVNMVLHYIMPVVMLIDWLATPPSKAIRFERALWWLAFPALYLLYSFIRGAFVSWYPYPFINPLNTDWSTIVATCLVILFGIVLLVRILILSKKRPLS